MPFPGLADPAGGSRPRFDRQRPGGALADADWPSIAAGLIMAAGKLGKLAKGQGAGLAADGRPGKAKGAGLPPPPFP